MEEIRSVAVFCGSSAGDRQEYTEEAVRLGRLLAQEAITMVYGGGSLGIMGATASACHESGGHVIGVLPEIFNTDKVLRNHNTSELIIVPDMHSRKEKMYSLADAFIILPGGIGTMEEFFETFTWKQIGYHRKNIVLLNIAGFYDTLILFLQQLADSGFMNRRVLASLHIAANAEEAIELIRSTEEALPDKIG